MIKKILLILIVLFLSAGLCFAGGNKEESEDTGKSVSEQKETKELVIVSQCVPSLDPVYDWRALLLHAVGGIEYLTQITPEGKTEPELAESYRLLNEHTWEVKLRPNVTFWSGKAADADAIKASLERARELAPQAKALLEGVKIEVMDNTTLHFVTENPNPVLPYTLSEYWLAIHNAESYGDEPNPYDLSVVDTTGKFRVVDYKQKEKIVYERWDGYWGEKPKIDRIVYKEITDPQARILAALSGESDIVLFVTPEGAEPIRNNPDMDLIAIKGTNGYCIYLNLSFYPFQDVRVRQALAWGLDRKEIVSLGLLGHGGPASNLFAQNPMYPEILGTGYKYDFEKASELLDEAGWILDSDGIRKKDGEPLSFRFLTTSRHKADGPVIQHQWEKLGIKVEVEHGDWGLWEAKKSSGDWEVGVGGGVKTGDPRAALARKFSPGGFRNYGGYNNEQMNNILERLADTFDEEQRKALVIEANQLLIDTVPIIPLYTRDGLMAINKNVTGLEKHFLWRYYLITSETDIIE